jgi:hypothetical protein
MPTSFYLLIPALAAQVVYFILFSKLTRTMGEQDKTRFIASGRPVLTLLALLPFILVVSPVPKMRLIGTVACMILLPLVNMAQFRRLQKAGMEPELIQKLARLGILSTAATYLVLLAVALR